MTRLDSYLKSDECRSLLKNEWNKLVEELSLNTDIRDEKIIIMEDLPIPGDLSDYRRPEKQQFLGSYSPMCSPGLINIYIKEHIELSKQIIKSIMYHSTLSGMQRTIYQDYEVFCWIFLSSIKVTLSHELFHHAMDVVGHMMPFTRRPDPEEPLAVYYSRYKLRLPQIKFMRDRTRAAYLRTKFMEQRYNNYSYPYDMYIQIKHPDDLLSYVFHRHLSPVLRKIIEELIPRIADLNVEIEPIIY